MNNTFILHHGKETQRIQVVVEDNNAIVFLSLNCSDTGDITDDNAITGRGL